MLWVALIFAGTLGMNRSLLREREHDCLHGLLLAPLDRGTIYLAKTAANFLFMVAAQVVLLPLFVFFFNLPMVTTVADADARVAARRCSASPPSARCSRPCRCARAPAR